MRLAPLVLAAALLAAASAQAQEHDHDHSAEGLTFHGFVNTIRDHQGGLRGDDKTFSTSMFMASYVPAWAAGGLRLDGMFSLEPLMGRGGYPLVFQTGETADGRRHLVDRQHPHDAWMQLAATFRRSFGNAAAGFVNVGWPGEPALGPPAFMHRASGMRIPEAPISHHWLDSTHITMGVATAGITLADWTFEASIFNGREPDHVRWNLEHGRWNSTSGRISWRPANGLSMQVSYGHLRDIEQVEAEVSVRRTTASISYQSDGGGHPWATTLAWGRNQKVARRLRHALPAWLWESTVEVAPRWTAFLRAEHLVHDEFSLELPFGKATLGGLYDVGRTGRVRWSVGALGSVLRPPQELLFFYGDHPTAWMVFVQARL